MGRALDDLSLRLWITLVELGGYTKVVELRTHFPREEAADVAQHLEALVANGMARAKGSDASQLGYGVTIRCAAPPGYEHKMGAAR